ncbi:hypothetical protein [Mesorhizobium erdmanii]|uniref:hypothetical protein n=1 Tax=Mesorhizobium erdmanii TaxID=1777866 RepID=UPI000A7BC0E5|nr:MULTISPECIES: hypothetical protein [Mesorhizobium]
MRGLGLVTVCIALLSACGTADAKADCELNSRLYRSLVKEANDKNSEQELQFVGGYFGTVKLTEYRHGKAVWVAHGEATCSNGISICYIILPLKSKGSVELPYETVETQESSLEMIVIPSLRENVYLSDWNALDRGKYGGLAVDLLGGFTPEENEELAPSNVYRYAGCSQPEKAPKDSSGTLGALGEVTGDALGASGEATGDAPLTDSMFQNCEKWSPSSACKKK